MRREDFQSGLSDLDLAISAQGLAAEQDALSPPEGEKPKVQVAGPLSRVAGEFAEQLLGANRKKLYNRSSRELADTKPKKPELPGFDEMEQAIGPYGRDKMSTEQIQVPLAEGQQGPPELMDIETPDQLTQLVEAAGGTNVPDSRSWAEVQARTDTVAKVMEELRPIAEGRQGGVLSDVQLHGVSRIVATAFDDVERIVAKISSGTDTPEDLVKLAHAKDTYEVMGGYLKGQGSEVGRALNSLKMSGEALKMRDFAAYEKMTAGDTGTGMSKTIKEWSDTISRRMEKGDTIGKAMEWANAALRSDKTKIAVEFWKNNQLSGVATHVVNNTSVMAHGLYENIVVRPVAAGVGAVRRGALGGEQPIQADELLAPVYSAYAGVRGSMGLFWDNLAYGKQRFDATDKVEDSGALSDFIQNSSLPKPVKQVADFATSASFKLLTATDEAHRGIGFTQELYALSSRQASAEGLTGNAHITRMNELLDEPPLEMYNKAMEHAKQMTFTDVESRGWIASTSKALRVMAGEVPPLQFIIPYINTPSNLLRVGMEMSPLAPLSKRLREDIAAGGVKADIATAKIIGGLGMGVMYWQLYESDLLTGSGPEDYKAQEMLKANGWQPWAIHVNGEMYGMERMDPLTKSAKFTESLANFLGEMDKAKYAATDDLKEESFSRAIMHLVGNMMEDQWMEQASGFMKALEGEEPFEKFIARTGAGFVPYHALLKTIKGQEGRPQLTQDKIESSILDMMEDQARGNMPDMGMDPHFVRIKRTWDGQPHIPEQGRWATAFPWSPTKAKNDPLTRAFEKNGVIPDEPSSVLTLGPKQLSLQTMDPSGRLYDNYLEIVGQERRKAIKEEVMPEYVAMVKEYGEDAEGPAGVIASVLRKGLDAGKKEGTGRFLNELKSFLIANPEIIQESPQMRGLYEFALDWEAVIEQSVEQGEAHWLKGPVQYQPTRSPFDSAIPEMK